MRILCVNVVSARYTYFFFSFVAIRIASILASSLPHEMWYQQFIHPFTSHPTKLIAIYGGIAMDIAIFIINDKKKSIEKSMTHQTHEKHFQIISENAP